MGVDSVGPKAPAVAPKPIDQPVPAEAPKPVEAAKPVEQAKPASIGQKLEAGFDSLKKKLMSISGRYQAPPPPISDRTDLKDLVAAQRSAANAGSVTGASRKEGFGGAITIDDIKKGNTGDSKKVDNPPNTEAAKLTTSKLDELKKSDKATGEALATPGGKTVEKALVSGVETPRAQLEAGQPGVLTPHQAERSAKAYGALGKEDRAKFDGLMAKAGTDAKGKAVKGSDPQREQALMLKALGAGRSVDDVKGFAEGDGKAKGIRGQNAQELTQQTTPYDLDGGGKDVGLYQQHGNSCAPTVGMMLEHENDPIKCRNFETASETDQARMRSEEQAKTLNTDNKIPVTREVLIENGKRLTDFDKQMDEMRAQEEAGSGPALAKHERNALIQHVNGDEVVDAEALKSAQSKVRDNPSSFRSPLDSNSELDAMRKVGQNSGMDSTKAYQKRAGVTGTDPFQYNVPNTPEGKDKAISAMQKDLEAGKAVPLGVKSENGGGHAMLAQGYDAKKGFLISDPMSGKTAWMSKDELKDGKFKDKFGISQDRLGTVTVDKPEGRKEVDKLFDNNENLKVKPAELAEAVKKNPEVLDHLTKTERSLVDVALKQNEAAEKKPELDKLIKGIENKDDEAVSRAINYDPSLLKHLDTDQKGKALEHLRGGSKTDVHAMQHIVRSCESKQELRNVLRGGGNKVEQATFHKYDKEMTDHHPYLIADLLNPENKDLPENKPARPVAVDHYPQHKVDTWPD